MKPRRRRKAAVQSITVSEDRMDNATMRIRGFVASLRLQGYSEAELIVAVSAVNMLAVTDNEIDEDSVFELATGVAADVAKRVVSLPSFTQPAPSLSC